MQISCQLLPLQIIDQASCFTNVQCFRCQGVVIDKRRDEMMRGGHLKFLLLPHAFLMEWIDLQSLFARVYMGTILVDWIRVELERLPPYELLDFFFGERWLLEVEAERCWANGFVIYFMEGSQVRVA